MNKNKLVEAFGTSKVLLPVIHVSSRIHVPDQITLALRGGAHGVWLICHGPGDKTRQLIEAYKVARDSTLDWIGLNFLGETDPVSIIQEELPPIDYPGGLWIDQGVEESSSSFNTDKLRGFYNRYRVACPKSLLFRGVAFKGQQPSYPSGILAAVEVAKSGMDILTTSGPGTGHAPDIGKIREIHTAANGAPVAVASGLTPENIKRFIPYIDCAMVSTGVCKPNTDEFDPKKLTAFAKAMGLEP